MKYTRDMRQCERVTQVHLDIAMGRTAQKEEAEMERLREQERIRSGKELQVSHGISGGQLDRCQDALDGDLSIRVS
jgi:hypothetical protein